MIHILMVVDRERNWYNKSPKSLLIRVRVELMGTAWFKSWTITNYRIRIPGDKRKYTLYARPPDHVLRPFMTLLVKFYLADKDSFSDENAFHEWKIDYHSKFPIIYTELFTDK